MILYIVNVLYDSLCNMKIVKNSSVLIEDTNYIAELGYIKRKNCIMNIHNDLLKVVDKLKSYYLKSEDMISILTKVLMNVCFEWIIEKYNETFYKYIKLEKKDIVRLIIGNLVIYNELAISV